MDPIKRYALDIAKEIIVAKMSNSTIHPNKENCRRRPVLS